MCCCDGCCCCSAAAKRFGSFVLGGIYLSVSLGLVIFMIKRVFINPGENVEWEAICVAQVVRHRKCVLAVGQVVERGLYIFALGQQVAGVIAIGQLSLGLVAVGQAGIGLFFSAFMAGVNLGINFCMAGFGLFTKGLITAAMFKTKFFCSLLTFSLCDLTDRQQQQGGGGGGGALPLTAQPPPPSSSRPSTGRPVSGGKPYQQVPTFSPPTPYSHHMAGGGGGGGAGTMGMGPGSAYAAPSSSSSYGVPQEPGYIKTYQVVEPSAPADSYHPSISSSSIPMAEVQQAEAVPVVVASVQDRLRELRGLLDQGLISSWDYDRRKEEILKEV